MVTSAPLPNEDLIQPGHLENPVLIPCPGFMKQTIEF